MKSKSEKEKKLPAEKPFRDEETTPKKTSAKNVDDDDIDDDDALEDVAPVKKGKSSAGKRKSDPDGDRDDDDEVDEVEDDWEKTEEEDYDPDFEEFDIPKSKTKKAPLKKGKGEDDFELDDDFKEMDLFNDGSGGVDDEDDDF